MSDSIRKKAVFHGRVQGVGFRVFCYKEASSLGARGWVRNRPDGTVELEAEAPAGVLQDLIARLRRGPMGARVDRVDENPLAPRRDDAEGFDIVS